MYSYQHPFGAHARIYCMHEARANRIFSRTVCCTVDSLYSLYDPFGAHARHMPTKCQPCRRRAKHEPSRSQNGNSFYRTRGKSFRDLAYAYTQWEDRILQGNDDARDYLVQKFLSSWGISPLPSPRGGSRGLFLELKIRRIWGKR
jgi:hypothetical protein